MSPNAIYTRAVKVGLYVPPAKRTGSPEPSVEASESAASAEPAQSGPLNGASRRHEEPSQRRKSPEVDSPSVQRSRPETEESARRSTRPDTEEPPRRQSRAVPSPSFESGGLGAAVQNFASLVERAALLERRVDDLSDALESSKRENRRLRRALREMEEISSQVAQVFRNAVLADE